MCVGIVKPIGTAVPSDTVLERCFIANPDGAGYGWYDPEAKCFKWNKGLSTFDQFLKEFHEEFEGKDLEKIFLMLHFRIGTHGGKTDPRKTHPFPVTTDYEAMCLLKGEAPALMMHNGILHDFGHLPDGVETEINPSDTMIFNSEVLSVLEPKKHSSIIKRLAANNRVVIAEPDAYYLYGFWQPSKQAEGCHFTNLNWENIETAAEKAEREARVAQYDRMSEEWENVDIAWPVEFRSFSRKTLSCFLSNGEALTLGSRKAIRRSLRDGLFDELTKFEGLTDLDFQQLCRIGEELKTYYLRKAAEGRKVTQDLALPPDALIYGTSNKKHDKKGKKLLNTQKKWNW